MIKLDKTSYFVCGPIVDAGFLNCKKKKQQRHQKRCGRNTLEDFDATVVKFYTMYIKAYDIGQCILS